MIISNNKGIISTSKSRPEQKCPPFGMDALSAPSKRGAPLPGVRVSANTDAAQLGVCRSRAPRGAKRTRSASQSDSAPSNHPETQPGMRAPAHTDAAQLGAQSLATTACPMTVAAFVVSLPADEDLRCRQMNTIGRFCLDGDCCEWIEGRNGRDLVQEICPGQHGVFKCFLKESVFASNRLPWHIQTSQTLAFRCKSARRVRGAVGCSLSHLAAFTAGLQQDACSHIVIFEDDAVWKWSPADTRSRIAAAFSECDVDILRLQTTCPRKYSGPVVPLTNGMHLRRIESSYGTVAIAYRKNALTALRSELWDESGALVPSDHAVNRACRLHGLKAFAFTDAQGQASDLISHLAPSKKGGSRIPERDAIAHEATRFF